MEEEIEQIDGKVLIFTDLHLGLSNNKESRMKIAAIAVKEILQYVKTNSIKTILFLGDWNHSRVITENQILNVSYKLMSALQKYCKIYLIVGNHDIYLKNSLDINSLVIFKDLPNVRIVNKVTPIKINSSNCLLVPWLGDTSSFSDEAFDLMFGHFDVSTKYLIQQYAEDNKMKQTATSLSDGAISAGDSVGDFVDCVKKNGVIFSGHIHGRRKFTSKGRTFIFVGSPYQQNLGEKDNLCGFYILNEDNSYEFHEIKNTPKHIEILISEILPEIDSYDFSIVRGNIIHKIYDVEVSRVDDLKISQKIQDNQPYDEILPEYTVKQEKSDDASLQTVELLKKSKLDYIKNYIQSIDQSALSQDNLSRDKLFEILEKYYNLAS